MSLKIEWERQLFFFSPCFRLEILELEKKQKILEEERLEVERHIQEELTEKNIKLQVLEDEIETLKNQVDFFNALKIFF